MNNPITTYKDIYFFNSTGNNEFVVFFDGFDWVVLSPQIEIIWEKM